MFDGNARSILVPVDRRWRIAVYVAVEYDSLVLALKHFAVHELDLRRIYEKLWFRKKKTNSNCVAVVVAVYSEC